MALAVKVVSDKIDTVRDKIDTVQAENSKRFDASEKKLDSVQAENSKRFDSVQAENSKRFDASEKKLDLLLSTVAPKMAAMETNLQWMRGDFGMANREHGPANQATKPPTDEPLQDEEFLSSPRNT